MWRFGVVTAVATCLLAAAVAGCGGSGASQPSDAQLKEAREEGEEAARERDRIDSLEKQVRKLKHQTGRSGGSETAERSSSTAEVSPPKEQGSRVLRLFHAPSGNVSCEISSQGALCSVGSVDETFSFENGQPAQIEPGTVLSDGAGELAPYGTVASAGSISCAIPQSDEPHGIICRDSDSGHGFEASRVRSRQHAY